MRNKLMNKKGFTLLEILAVVLIIGILASVSLPLYQKFIVKSRAAEAINLLEAVKDRQQVNFAKSKVYIDKASDLKPLTSSSPETAGNDDLFVNENYKISLQPEKQCAIVTYSEKNSELFSFAV